MARTAHAALLVKQERAVSLYAEGHSYDDIAEELGYSHRGSAWKAVDRALTAERDLRAGDFLQTQIDRYEAVLCKWWDLATTGRDARAANVVLRALERLDKLLHLGDAGPVGAPETIVITGSPEEYAKQLREVVESRDGRPRAAR